MNCSVPLFSQEMVHFIMFRPLSDLDGSVSKLAEAFMARFLELLKEMGIAHGCLLMQGSVAAMRSAIGYVDQKLPVLAATGMGGASAYMVSDKPAKSWS
jgi:hypothetical protein